jgi:hypothetical protein
MIERRVFISDASIFLKRQPLRQHDFSLAHRVGEGWGGNIAAAPLPGLILRKPGLMTGSSN